MWNSNSTQVYFILLFCPLNNITYCFFGVDSLGNVASLDSWGDFQKPFGTALGGFGSLQELKQQRTVTLGLSIGGWNNSANFSSAVSTESNRVNFINSLKKICWIGISVYFCSPLLEKRSFL